MVTIRDSLAHKKRKKHLPKIMGTLFCLALITLSFLFMLEKPMTGIAFFDYRVLRVLSDSMTPTFSSNDLIVIKRVPSSALKTNDIITFQLSDEAQVSHRISQVLEEGEVFITKGDANEHEDVSPVKAEQVVGKKVGKLKYLGKMTGLITKPAGLIALGITLLFCRVLKLFIQVLRE